MTATYPPGPKGEFLLGNLRPFAKDPPGYLVRAAHEFGDLVLLRLGPTRAYLVSHPDLVREVLVTQAKRFHKSKMDQSILGKFLGRGLLISNGDFHRRQRALVQPAFHTGRIEAYAQVMVDYTRHMLANWAAGQVRQIDEDMMKLTMFIVAKTLFDADVSAEAEQAGRAIQELQEAANLEYRRSFAIPMWLPTPNNRKYRRATAALDAVIHRIIADRRATAVDGRVRDTGDLLSMLLLAQDEDGRSMDDTQVRDEAATLFAAGHETTSNALAWTWYLLCRHPEVQDRLHAELDQVLNGRAPTVADLERLVYTEMVIKEAMRLYPPAWILAGRTPTVNIALRGCPIPAGSLVLIAPYVLHRRPDTFPDPERFDPERFRPEREKELPRYAYLPFGGGPRVCIGNHFALMEARLILATIAQRYRLALEPGQSVELQPQITLSPKNGLRMRLESRS
jgi:cytochrome P450